MYRPIIATFVETMRNRYDSTWCVELNLHVWLITIIAMPRILRSFKTAAVSLPLFQLPISKAFASPLQRHTRTMTSHSCLNQSIQEFLLTLKQNPTNHIVIGNTAGDADSIISAVTHAYVTSAQESSRSAGFTSHDFLTPVMSITQRDLETTRPETLILLKWAELPTDDLFYVDNTEVPKQATRVTLVDHNHLQADAYNHCEVPEIVDHHKDEENHDECQKRRIAYSDGKVLVASTCTLVVEALMEHPIQLPPKSQAALSTLLLGVILLDSVNLKGEAGKVTDRDRAAVSFLLKETDWNQSRLPSNCMGDGPVPDTSKIFDALQGAKFDRDFWMSLSVRDALRLDYKSFQDNLFGISSVLMAWDDFKDMDELISGMNSFLGDCKTSVLIVMLASQASGGTLKRELVLYSSDTAEADRIANFLESSELALRQVPTAPDEMIVYDQGNAKASRKQVAPLIQSFFDE